MPNPDRFLLAGVMGWPVMHSRSPLMHNFWMKQKKLTGSYIPLAISPDRLADALRGLYPLGFAGCNLTIPHKQAAIKIVDQVDNVSSLIGAISCVVVRPNGSIFGINNDWREFIDNLKQRLPNWRAETGSAAVIGGGGASWAICYGLMNEGVKEIRLVNRTREKAEKIADDLNTHGDSPIRVLPWDMHHDGLDGVSLCVNTTSQGMVGQEPLDLKLDCLSKTAVAYDIIYTPLETPFLAQARTRGNFVINGLGMLLYQGLPAWKMWFDIEPKIASELRQMMESNIARI